MNKKIKGSELIKKIENYELKEGQKIKFTSTLTHKNEKIVKIEEREDGLYLVDTETEGVVSTGWLINSEIEILEDNTEEIEELPDDIDEFGWLEVRDKINELVRAVKEIRKDLNK